MRVTNLVGMVVGIGCSGKNPRMKQGTPEQPPQPEPGVLNEPIALGLGLVKQSMD